MAPTPTKSRNRLFNLSIPILFLALLPLETTWGADYFAKPEFGGTCTRTDPCFFITAVNNADNGDTVYFKQGVYTDNNFPTHVLYITKSVNLLGGWDGAPTGPLFRRPDTYPSILDGGDQRRVIYINGLITPMIDGFTIIRGNATNWATNCSGDTAKGCGGGIFVYRAGARIINNRILNNQAHTIAGENGYGGGIHLEGASGAVIRNNMIQGNRAAAIAGGGGGGGLSIYGIMQDMVRINGNLFISNSAEMGGGISSTSLQATPAIYNNIFDGNSALMGAGLILWGESTISTNRFQNHQGQEVIFWAGPQGIFEKNTIVGNNANAGLSLYMGNPPFPRFSNNIIAASGTNAITARASQPNPLFASLEHNTFVGGGGGSAISVPLNNYVTLTMTNNIIAGFPVGIENDAFQDSSVTARYTLFGPEVTTPGANVHFENSLTGDPAFKNPAAGNYHIRMISAARDAGTSVMVTTEDIDGDPRPIGRAPDIGADEFSPLFLYLPLIKK